jgi:hypothetical protein
MRFMVMVKANKDSEAGVLPSEQELIAMGAFNEELIKAGIMLAGEGLKPSSKGVRMKFARGAKPTVTDGPFAEVKELIGGFWIVNLPSKEEAVRVFSRCPWFVGELEIRPVFEAEDFAPVIQTDRGRAVLDAEQEFRDRTGSGTGA